MITKGLLIAFCVWLVYSSPRSLRAQWRGESPRQSGKAARWARVLVGRRRLREWARGGPISIVLVYATVLVTVMIMVGAASGLIGALAIGAWVVLVLLTMSVASTGRPRGLVPPSLRSPR